MRHQKDSFTLKWHQANLFLPQEYSSGMPIAPALFQAQTLPNAKKGVTVDSNIYTCH